MSRRFLQVALTLAVCIMGGCTEIPSLLPTMPAAGMSEPTSTQEPPVPLQVAYIKDGDIWIWDYTKAIRGQLTCGEAAREVSISSNGLAIAFRTQAGELKVVRRDNIDQLETNLCNKVSNTTLVNLEYLNSLNMYGGSGAFIRSFKFSNGTNDVYFNVDVTGVAGGIDIFKVNLDTLLPVRLVAPGQGGNFHLAPSAQWIVVTIPNHLILQDTNGVNALELVGYPPQSGFGAHGGPEIVWHDNLSEFYVVTPRYNNNDDPFGISDLSRFSLENGWTQEQMGELLALPHSETHIAPNGLRVANLVDYGDLVDLHIVERNNTSDTVYVSYPSNNIGFVKWAIDGMSFVYWLDKSGQRSFYIGIILNINDSITYDVPHTLSTGYPIFIHQGGRTPFEWVVTTNISSTDTFLEDASFLYVGSDSTGPLLILHNTRGPTELIIDRINQCNFDVPDN